MRRFLLLPALLATMLLAAPKPAAADGKPSRVFRQAVGLFDGGMFERARTLFESLGDDPLARGYVVLCAVMTSSPDYPELIARYDAQFPYSQMSSRIHWRNALVLFGEERYAEAADEFARVNPSTLDRADEVEYLFKQSYSLFGAGRLQEAQRGFETVERKPFSDYTAPSRYALGYIHYARHDFEKAHKWFAEAAKDPRFEEMASYYIVECKFMQKDYQYVVDKGVALYDKVPQERKSHLARIISESYLVLGDAAKAREYYEQNIMGKPSMNRADYFYAGSVLYAVEDWQGAIDNYSMMTARTDSLGQVANYQMGYSYIQTKNKVAALEAFRDASEQAYDTAIQEDAYFNYAKLAFDLNHDTSVFNDYMARYADKAKNDRIWAYMAMAALYDHDYAGAVAAYDNIDDLTADMRGNYMKANYLRANQLIANGSWRDAIPMLRATAYYGDRHDGFNQLARYWLAQSYFNDGRYPEARTTLQDLYNNSALDGRAEGKILPYDIAYTYFREGGWADASKWFDKYLAQGDVASAEDAAVRRADCDFARKDYKEAIAAYRKAIETYGAGTDDLYARYQCALAYGLTGGKQQRIEILEPAKEAAPTVPYYSEALYELGRAYVAAGNEDDAIRAFRSLKATTPDKTFAARALIELGMISRNKGNGAQALEYYKQVVEQYPDAGYTEDALLAIESIYQAAGDADKYLAYAEKIGAVAGKTPAEKEALYFNAAEQLCLAGNHAKALGALDTYREKYPEGSRIGASWFYTAQSLSALGRKELACDTFEKVMTTYEDYAEPSARLFADLSYGMEKYEDALRGYQTLEKVARIPDNAVYARTGAMRSAYRARKWTEAVAAADAVRADKATGEDLAREADYIKAKSLLSSSQREKAYAYFETLAQAPSTDEGAEACYMLIQRSYDTGDFADVEKRVYALAKDAPEQSYWLARSFIVLGDAFAERDNLAQAKATFESILGGYVSADGGTDDVLDNVRMRLSKLEKMNGK